MIKYRFPFMAIIGQDDLSLALILNLVNPRIGGVLIRGTKGTGKSTAVYGLPQIAPLIKVHESCSYNCSPEDPGRWCPFCKSRQTHTIIEKEVEVVNLRFAEGPAVAPINEPAGFMGMLKFTKDDVMYVIELGVMMLLGLLVIFMVVRPLVRRILAADPQAQGAAPALTDGSAPAIGADGQPLAVPQQSMVDIAQVQGQVHAQTVHRVGELADRNPNETVAIIRQWLQEPA